ncbi:RNA polymerase sigma factor [Runella salmonicolor]|uniref:Sigma-70 family RNA polymerase sigma factor n=1 Tax=Runella salmonicolor TaxID=2950278 RepID=A0ABT1FXR8_9BACT|nr:sigma-70 family RNA polymerase sigma factor [Runella salmonicolor]MCP1386501.1 sigma-70 family RNA polymerase sigma factor [Runella salmonicolor]
MTVNSDYTDQQLLADVQHPRGVNQAVTYLYKSHYRLLERYILNNSGNSTDAQDLIQEVMVSFVEMVREGKYRGEASVKSFLYTLTRNLWITELRKRGAEAKRNEIYETNREQWDDDINAFISYKEAQKTITALFEKLGEKCRKILTLFYYEDLSMKEILVQTHYENEQVLRNRKYKCLKEMTDLVHRNSTTFEHVKSALERLK